MSFPEAERASEREAIWLDESVFRAGERGIDDVVTAIAKIQSNTAALAVANTVQKLALKSMQFKPVKTLMDFYISQSDK
jgi:hypothetical protein